MIQIMPSVHLASNPKVKYLQNSEHTNLSDTGYWKKAKYTIPEGRDPYSVTGGMR